MLDFNLKMVKLVIFVSLAAMVLFIMGGVNILKESYFDPIDSLQMHWDYIATKVEFSPNILGNYLPFGADSDSNQIISRKGNHAQSVPVLLYHGVIRDEKWEPDDISVKLDDFKKQMLALKESGYRTVTLEDFSQFLEGKKNLPEKSFLLTFDDARRDSFFPVDPVLKALDWNAVMFVITDRSLGPESARSHFHLSEKELRGVARSGRWELASHGKNDHDLVQISADGKQGHFLSNKMWLKYEGRMETEAEFQKRITEDLEESKKVLEERIGIRVLAYAYPFGDFGQGSENFPASSSIILRATEEIYPHSFHQAKSSEYTGNFVGDSFQLRRIVVNSKIRPRQLLTKIANGQSKTKSAYFDDFLTDHGWLEGWGTRIIDKDLMLTGANPAEDSSLTFLDGSYLWKNYILRSRVRLAKGRSFAVLARYKNGDNYVSCDFDQEQVAISQRFRGLETTLVKIDQNLDFISQKEIEAGIIIEDEKLSCLVDGKIVAEAILTKDFDSGGVGFKTWDASLNNSSLVIKSVKVDNIRLAPVGETLKGTLSGEWALN